jgi:hypothetical protein
MIWSYFMKIAGTYEKYMKKSNKFLMTLLVGLYIVSTTCYMLLVTSPLNKAHAQESTTYKLKGYEFGGGGGTSIESTSYSMEGILGEGAGDLESTSYKVGSGLTFVQNANTPPAPTFTNDSGNRYNKLKLVVNKDSGDPSDAKYAVAISADNFASDLRYVQSDGTIGATLGAEDYQTYAAWGGASGLYVINLVENTTYTVKVKSTQGIYTESPYSATAQAATVPLRISFDIDIGGSSDPGETAAPYTIAFSDLSIGTVNTATNRGWIDFETNAEAGGYIYVYDQYAGLRSNTLNYTIPSVSSDLVSVSEGYGLQGASKTQTSGGPLSYVSPYDGTSNTVGIVNSTIREIFNTSSLPIVAARGSFSIKAKVANTTPGSSDYTDTLTLIAASSF